MNKWPSPIRIKQSTMVWYKNYSLHFELTSVVLCNERFCSDVFLSLQTRFWSYSNVAKINRNYVWWYNTRLRLWSNLHCNGNFITAKPVTVVLLICVCVCRLCVGAGTEGLGRRGMSGFCPTGPLSLVLPLAVELEAAQMSVEPHRSLTFSHMTTSHTCEEHHWNRYPVSGSFQAVERQTRSPEHGVFDRVYSRVNTGPGICDSDDEIKAHFLQVSSVSIFAFPWLL